MNISSKHWVINDSIIVRQDRTGLWYRVSALPAPGAPFARWGIGYVSLRQLTLPDNNAPLSHHFAVAKNAPTEVQVAEMKAAILSLNVMTTRFEEDWLPRDSTGKLNRELFKRMWRGGWRGVNKYEPKST